MNKIYEIVAGKKARGRFTTCARRYTKDTYELDEVLQELMLYYLQMNPDTLKDIYKKSGTDGLIGYGCVVIKRSLTSPRSPYFYKINKYYTRISSLYDSHSTLDHKEIKKNLNNIPEEIIPQDYIKLDQIDVALDGMYWYDREIFKLYYFEGNTLDSLAEKTKISRNSLFTTIDKVRKELKELLNAEDE